jgi:hypothetical protein
LSCWSVVDALRRRSPDQFRENAARSARLLVNCEAGGEGRDPSLLMGPWPMAAGVTDGET